MPNDDGTGYVVHCPNPGCGIIFKPDPIVFRDGDNRCPRCGADLNEPPPSIGRCDEGDRQ